MAEASSRVKIRDFARSFEPPASDESARMDPYNNMLVAGGGGSS